MMSRTSAEAARLEAAGYMLPGNRPRCASCVSANIGQGLQANQCTRHYAQVARDGLCGYFVPAPGAQVGPIIASRCGRSGRVDDHKATLLTLASRPDGVTNGQLADAISITSKAAGTKLARYTQRAELFAVATMPKRWFATQQAADEWAAGPGQAAMQQASEWANAPKGAKPPRPTKAAGRPGADLVAKPKAGTPAPVTGNTTGHKPQGPATNPNNVQPQYGRHYTHDTRHQCAPGERPHGAGFVAAGIGINPSTGQPWEART